MSQNDTDVFNKARRAREQLAAQYLSHPDVTLIDIGYVPDRATGTQKVALRIHVRDSWLKAKPENRVSFPYRVDGIPVAVIGGEYKTE
ncbi:MAG: hypothetical protein KDE54_20550 [Caldilineaceae bacterium]|nr:hypothetical protein [Caldilineaceae bacterium]MCB0128082.1 hypothetical protein [Caldilineaceae bacterium]MCB0143746.1 hypothetical protein [Caldilineaceae bacterium]